MSETVRALLLNQKREEWFSGHGPKPPKIRLTGPVIAYGGALATGAIGEYFAHADCYVFPANDDNRVPFIPRRAALGMMSVEVIWEKE